MFYHGFEVRSKLKNYFLLKKKNAILAWATGTPNINNILSFLVLIWVGNYFGSSVLTF